MADEFEVEEPQQEIPLPKGFVPIKKTQDSPLSLPKGFVEVKKKEPTQPVPSASSNGTSNSPAPSPKFDFDAYFGVEPKESKQRGDIASLPGAMVQPTQDTEVQRGIERNTQKVDKAIINTIKRPYAQHNQKFDEKSPNVQKAIKTIKDLQRSGEYTVAKGRDGNDYIVPGQGFWDGLWHGAKESVTNSVDAAKLNTIIDPNELAATLNKRSAESPVVPSSAPTGLGNIGHTLGGAPKMMAEAALPVVGEGLMAADAYQTARAQKMENLYWEGKSQGLNDHDAAKKAMLSSLVSAIPDAVSAVALNRIGLKGGASSEAAALSAQGLKDTLKKMVGSNAKVAGIFGGAQAGSNLAEKAFGYNKDTFDKVFDAMGEGALMDFGFKALHGAFKLPKYAIASVKEHLNSLPKEVIDQQLSNMGEAGNEIKKQLQQYGEARKQVEGLVPEEHISTYAGLTEKRDALEKSKEGKSKALTEPIDEQIKAIDSQLSSMQKTGKVNEVDDITGEPVEPTKAHEELTKPQREGIVVPKEYGTAEVIEVGEGENKTYKPKASYTVKEGSLEISKPIKFEEEKTYTDKDKAQAAADEALGKHYYENVMPETEKPIAKHTARPATEELTEEEKLYGKKEDRVKLDNTGGKRIIEPSKPISEMNSEELDNYANDYRKALKAQDKEFEGKTEEEKQSGGYNDISDEVENIRNAAQRVNFVENSENISDLANSVKSTLSNMKGGEPNEYELSILNAAKNKATELGIEPEALIKEIASKVANQFKDIEDAEFMVKTTLQKLIPKNETTQDTKQTQIQQSTEVKEPTVTEIIENKQPSEKEQKQQATNDLIDRAAAFQKMRKNETGRSNELNEIKNKAAELGLEYRDATGKIHNKNGKQVQKVELIKNSTPFDGFDSNKYSPETNNAVSNLTIHDDAIAGLPILGTDGKRLSAKQRADALKSIREGNPTHAGKAIIDFIDKAVNEGGIEIEDVTTGQRVKVPLDEYVKAFEQPVKEMTDAEFDEINKHLENDAFHVSLDDLIKQIENENANRENQTPNTGTTKTGKEGIDSKENSSGTSGKEPPTEPIEEKDYNGLTGIKNAVSNATRSELVLPKVDVPKLGKDVQVLHEGKVLVEEGKVNPQEVVNRIISTNNHNMSRDESKAMQYYMHQLGKAQDLVNEQLSLDLEPKEKLDLICQQQQLSDLQDAATEANIKAGKDWSDVGNIRQILVDQSFNPSREKAVIKEAYGGQIPKEVKEKLDNLTKERDAALQERNRLEELLRNREAGNTINKIKKNPKTKAEHQQKRADLIQQIKDAKAEHDKYLKDNGIQQSGIGGIALTPKMLKLIGELAADYVVEGVQKLSDVIDKVYEEIKLVLPGVDKKEIRDAIALHDVSKLDKKGEGLEEKIKNNDIQESKPKLKPKFQTNNEWVKANQRVINAEYKIKKLKNEALNSQKNAYQKGLMWASKLVRASVLSGTNVLYKLASAATIGGAGKRIPEQIIGQMWSNIFKGIAQKAPIEGFTNAKAEARFYKDFFNPKKFVNNTWQIFKSGSSNLTKKMDGRMNDDLAEITMPGKQTTVAGKIGKGALIGINKALEFPTDLHMVIKEPLKRAVFEASVKNGMVWAEKNGLDINDPLVVNSIENAAYKRANYEIFQEENALSKKFNGWKSKMDKSGNAGATGKLLADFLIPVSTVPTNIVKRIISTSPAGLIRGGVKVTEAYRKGIENLTNEEADAVMRQLKQGTLGTALWLTGWFAASHFGGLYSKYDPNKKRQEGELTSDQMEVNGEMIPKPVQHALPLEIIQTAATARHIYDNYRENKGSGNVEALTNAGLGSIGALAEHVPIVSTAGLALEAGQDPYKGEKLKEDMQRRFEPQILRETGVIGKKGKTDLENLIERNTTDGNIFRNELKAFDENGKARDISLSEFKKYKEERAANLTDRLKKLYEGKDEFNTFKDKSGNAVTKKYSEMTAKEQLEAIQAVKAQATAETKKKLFGKYESTDADDEVKDRRNEIRENN